MKTKLTFLIAFIAAFWNLRAQGPEIPNGGFENWVNNYIPVGWMTVDGAVGDSLGAAIGELVGLTREDTVDFVQGHASIKLIADSVPVDPSAGVQPGLVSLGTGKFTGSNIIFNGAPFYYRPDTLFFSYKYTSPGKDTAGVYINLVNGDSGIAYYPFGFTVPLDTTSQWVVEYILMTPYLNAKIPDSLTLQFVSSIANNPVKGSTLHIDDVFFSYTTVLQETATSSGKDTICIDGSVTLTGPVNESYNYYQWYLNSINNPIAGANSASYVASDSGLYYVIIDSLGIPGLSEQIAVTLNTNCTSGIVDIAPGVNLNVYPNPTSGILNVTSNQDLSGYNIRLFDVVGRMVANQVLEGALNNTLNVSALSNGTYIYRITDKLNATVTQNKFTVIK